MKLKTLMRKNKLGVCSVGLISALSLVGCATTATQKETSLAESIAAYEREAVTASAVTSPTGLQAAVIDTTVSTPAAQTPRQGGARGVTKPKDGVQIFHGTDRVVRGDILGGVNSLPASQENMSLKFDQAPVTDVVHAVMGDLLKLPYVINQPISGSITIDTRRPMGSHEMLSILETLLESNGLLMRVDSSGVYHIGRPETLRGITPAVNSVSGGKRNQSTGNNLLVVPLQFIGAEEMANILSGMASPDSIVRVDSVRNLLVLSGGPERLEGLRSIISTFDVDLLKGMSVGLFPLKNLPVKEVQNALQAVFAGKGGSGNLGGPLGGVVRIFPLEKISSLLVISPRRHYIDEARKWIDRFDQPQGNSDEARLFVYPVQNGNAKHLSKLMTSLFSGGEREDDAVARDSGVAPGLDSAVLGAAVPPASGQAPNGAMLEGDNFVDQSSGTNVGGLKLSDKVKVIADEVNNLLLIYAPERQYRKIEAALRRMDIAPKQVLIETTILEVSLTDELRYGLQWFFNGKFGGRYQGEGVLSSGKSNVLGGRFPGFSYTITNPLGKIRAVLTALADKSLVNVISSPTLMVQDNHTAAIKVGDQQPVRSATTISDGGVTTSSIQYKETGVSLSVTPSVNSGDLVSMKIKQSITDVGDIDSATGQRSFLQRHVESQVAVRSGESIVLGGLIKDNSTRGRNGLPVLQEVPLFGHLFSNTIRTTRRTELLIMITPRVLRSQVDLKAVEQELRMRMRSLEGLQGRIGAEFSEEKAKLLKK